MNKNDDKFRSRWNPHRDRERSEIANKNNGDVRPTSEMVHDEKVELSAEARKNK